MNKDYTISEIEALTYEQAKEMTQETLMIKDHECFIVDLGEYFGYSILVFRNEKHIYYANDYELHHRYIVKEKGLKALRERYIKSLNHKLYTDAELLEPVKSYDEYKAKEYFLRNYWIMQYDTLSIFGIGNKAREEFEEKKKDYPFYSDVCFCYVKDESIVNDARKYLHNLKEQYKKLKEDTDAFRKMVKYEFENYEVCVSGDFEPALDALGIKYSELTNEQQKIVMQEYRKQMSRTDW